MIGEIDRDFYCSAGLYEVELDNLNKLCNGSGSCLRNLEGQCCSCRHRKYPTPKQYKEEYGKEYPEGGAVYMNDDGGAWWASSLTSAKMYEKLPREVGRSFYIVCACTPWGKPPNNWRPE